MLNSKLFGNLLLCQLLMIIQRLASPSLLRPRLEIPFQLWGALLENPQWRQQLGQLRFGQSNRAIVQLSRWLQNTIDAGWQTLESLLGNQPDLAYQFRTTAEFSAAIQRIKVLQFGEQTYWLFVGIEPEDALTLLGTQLRSQSKEQEISSAWNQLLRQQKLESKSSSIVTNCCQQ
ncbi:DUF1822 family protein [Leptolyngbya sp. NIES-2104]|uniref:DUF1822 family protein n=1 Tax=Leptolyngbya sp. NIES-2104 TaxID=1552121 RepID=UPI0006ECB8D4|nr:DUF1822 family protein [Leptolyngbya sp. NIES-2104]GAP95035.1 hypothetical protein NIES2104_15550 [Leptolyngbya sp. NIES-2104]